MSQNHEHDVAPQGGELTPEQRAERIMTWYEGHTTESVALRDEVAAAIRDAVADEREACAKIADDFHPWNDSLMHDGRVLLRRDDDLHQSMATGAVIGATNIARLIRKRSA